MKKASKRILSVFLAIVLIFGSAYVGLAEIDFNSLFAVRANAASTGTTGDCTWTLDGTVLTISGTGEMASYTSYSSVPWYSSRTSIKSIVLESGVTSIGSYAFCDCSSLTSITIPDSVTSIGDSAFEYCSSLTSITIPDSVISIGDWTFSRCKSLTSITIPDSVTSIGHDAFNYCTSLTSITIPDSVTSIGYGAFQSCENLTSVTISDGVTYIGEWTFWGCSSLTSITIPDSVTSIGEEAFGNCDSLKKIFYTGSQNDWSSITIASANGALTAAVIYYSFTGHTYSTEWTIDVEPTCTEDGSKSHHCTVCGDKTDVTVIEATGHHSMSYDICQSCGMSDLWKYTLYDDYALITGYKGSESDVVIPAAILGRNDIRIGSNTFQNLTTLTSIMIPDTVTSIGDYAFYKCTALTSVTMGENVTSIGYSAFRNCTSLTSITIPNSVTSIGTDAFYNCASLTSITIPDSVTRIGEDTFGYCVNLTSITIPRSVASIGYKAFSMCNSLKNIFYTGSQNDWSSITIASGNEKLNSAAIHYNSTWHTYSTEWTIDVEPTCTEDGSKSHHCTTCGDKKDVTVIEATGHHYDEEWTIDVEPTCTEDGSKSHHCTVCGDKTDVTVIDATGHNYSDWVIDKAPTCTENGSKSHHCTTCGDKADVTVIEATGHSYGDWVIDRAPTCTVDGTKHKTCSACGDVVTETIERKGHSYSDWVVVSAPTCTESGEARKACSSCGETLICSDGFVSVLVDSALYPESAHNYGDKISETYDFSYDGADSLEITFSASTMVEKNYDFIYIYDSTGALYGTYTGSELAGVTITFEGNSFTIKLTSDISNTNYGFSFDSIVAFFVDELALDIIKPLEHNYSTEWTIDVEPTCTEEGSKSHHCTACGDKTDVTVIEETGHSYGEWIIDKEPTCTEDGSKYRICSVCDDNNTEVIFATNHPNTVWIIEKEPTCTETGYKDEYCLECAELINTAVIPTAAHSYSSEWTIDVEPTCTENGSKSHHCTACGAKGDITAILPLGHNYKEVSAESTHPHTISFKCTRCSDETQEGIYSPTCIDCNFTYDIVDDETCKITGYIGTGSVIKLPGFIDGRVVVTTTTGAFKNNNIITSVRVEDGVQGLGSLAFLGCKNLKKIVLPGSVTSIGTNAFYNCASDFTIYCYRDTYAMQYAIDNSHNYVIMDIGETNNSTIDYENKMIFSTVNGITSLEDMIYIPSTSSISTEASLAGGGNEFYGTGSKVKVTDNGVISEYTLIVYGDTNGDSVCDALDAAQVALASNGHSSFEGVYELAADNNGDGVVDINDYQAVVNKAVS